MNFFEVLSYLLIYIALPVAGIAALAYLAILLSQAGKTLKSVDGIISDVEYKLELLNGPIELIANLSGTLSSINKIIKKKGER